MMVSKGKAQNIADFDDPQGQDKQDRARVRLSLSMQCSKHGLVCHYRKRG
jgi:hypothetical protein